MYDVAIIGAGVTGCFVAKELSRYNLKVAVFEKNPGVGLSQTKENCGVIYPFQLPLKSLKGKLCLEGNKMIDKEAKELGFNFRRVGLILIATDNIKKLLIPVLKRKIEKYVELRVLNKEEIIAMEKNLKDEKIKGGIYIPSAGITNPVEMCFSSFLFSKLNGVDFLFNCKVRNIKRFPDHFLLETDEGTFKSNYVINCTGIYADEVAKMVGCETRAKTKANFVRCIYVTFDDIGFSNHLIVPISINGKDSPGLLISADNRTILGPKIVYTEGKEDDRIHRREVEELIDGVSSFLKNLPEKVSAYCSGVRSARDLFINQPVRNFINVFGDANLAAVPAIARYVLRMLASSGINLKKKEEIKRVKIVRFSELSDEERERIIKENPKYGRIICLCHLVSEAEVEEVLKLNPCFDSVRHVTGAGKSCEKCHADIMVFIQRSLNYLSGCKK